MNLKQKKNKLFLPTCYEQLYKETKEMNNDIAKKCFDLKKENKQLKTECEEWKKDYATAKGMYDLCQSDFMELAKIKDNYRQALQEIKEIANKNEVCPYDISHLCVKDKCKRREDCEIAQILEKCEVLDES